MLMLKPFGLAGERENHLENLDAEFVVCVCPP